MTKLTQTVAGLRRQFALPEEDVDYLDILGLDWETIIEGRGRWVLIQDHPLPAGYTANHTNVAIQVAPGYPTAPLDMAYFYPALRLSSGRAIPTSQTQQQLDGKVWQRWSRHRTAANPWRPGIDNLKTHHFLIQAWLEREPRR